MAIAKKENIVARTIHGASFLIDVSDNYSGDTCSLYEINQTGMFIWNNIDGTRSVKELAELLQAAIIDDVDFEVLHEDVSEFVSTLLEKRFLEE